MHLTQTAYAKINLALHVRARKENGYHELETLFAFVDAGDRLVAHGSNEDRFSVTGEFAGALTNPFDNIVMQALSTLPRPDGLAITLEKNLPVAAGLGGGSADAGAIFRMVRDGYSLPDDWRVRAAKLGADVPACVESETCVGRGIGTELEPVENDLAGMAVLLVNPRVALSTGPVFAKWGGGDDGPLPQGTAKDIFINGINGLEEPAVTLCPIVADILEQLRVTRPMAARMSGSGATCFALYNSDEERDMASQHIAAIRPDWWQMRGHLR